ncbi:MAG: hypothetical protein ACXWZE_07880 [Candidatus Binatia bacterium]
MTIMRVCKIPPLRILAVGKIFNGRRAGTKEHLRLRMLHLGWSGNNQSTEVSRDLLVKFGRGQRRIMTGVKYVVDEEDGVSAVEQAELMIALFQSIDRDCFDLRVSAKIGEILELIPALSPDDVIRRLPVQRPA